MVLLLFGLSFRTESVAETSLGKALVSVTHLREPEPALTAGGDPEQGKLERQSNITAHLIVGFREPEFQPGGESAIQRDMLAVKIREADGRHDAHCIFAVLVHRFLRVDVAGGAEKAAVGDVAAKPQPLQQTVAVAQRNGE